MPAQTETFQGHSRVPEQARTALQTAYNPDAVYGGSTETQSKTSEEIEAARIGCYLAYLARQDTVVVSAGPCSSRVVTRLGSLGSEIVEVVQGT